MKNSTTQISNDLAELSLLIDTAESQDEGADAVGRLADRWAAFAKTCSSDNAALIAASFEVGITFACALQNGETGRSFWQKQLDGFKRSVSCQSDADAA